MTKPLSIALIGLGEVGQILAEDLAFRGVKGTTAYDILFSVPSSGPSRSSALVRKCGNVGDAVHGRSLIISAVTAASDLAVAQAVAPHIAPDAFFLDLNSVSPGQKQASANVVNRAGGRYVEAAVMTPFPPKRIASPMLLGGPHARAFLEVSKDLGLNAKAFSERYGQASATKMCRSVIIKGTEALLMESLLAARYYGVDSAVLASLSDLLPVGDWHKLATYMISRSLEHGVRRAEEMREVAETVTEAKVSPLMTLACVERQEWAATHRQVICSELGTMLDGILASEEAERVE